jgi:site-specific recombinase XerD
LELKENWIVQNEKLHPENQKILNEFLVHMRIKNLSSHTIRNRLWFLQGFLIFIDKPLTSLTQDDILDWINEKCTGVKEATVSWRLGTLSVFIKFCQEKRRKYIDDSVYIKKRWKPKIPKPLPKYLDEDELARTKIAADKQKLRDRAIFGFTLDSGCRVGEVAGLELRNVDLENRTAVIKGKGRKVRQVHFSEKSGMLLEKVIENHPRSDVTVFLNKDGNRMHERSFQNIMIKIGAEAGLAKKLMPHQIRHTFATRLLNKGAPLEFISEELGHSNISTTTIYARVLDKSIIESYRKCMG